MTDTLRDEVRRHYARAALAVLEPAGCCGADATTTPGDPVFGPGLYDPEQLGPAPRRRGGGEPGLRQSRPRWPTSGRARSCSTSGPAAASTSSSRPSASARRGSPTGST